MKTQTVEKRIFVLNAWMVIITLILFLTINVGMIRVYTEAIEHEFQASVERIAGDDVLEELLADYTIHKKAFGVVVLADGLLCAAGLIVVSQIFSRKLAKRIMTPLHILTEGANRIQNKDLTQAVVYQGDLEFEEVCAAFNEMQQSILTEQERNQKYEKARTDMIAGVSHDLRTPLTAIRGTIKAILDGVVSAPEQEKRFLQTAYRRTGEMDVLLNQLFYLSKLETGNMPLNLETVEIAALLESYVKEKKELYGSELFEIKLEKNEVQKNVAVDPKQFFRILDNLLENSRKYAGEENLKIELSLLSEENMVEIQFADNGAGVPEEKLPHIFEEFYRVDESRHQKEGSGLGLYIVKYLVEAMGGSVTAENRNGLLICIRLPERKTEQSACGQEVTWQTAEKY